MGRLEHVWIGLWALVLVGLAMEPAFAQQAGQQTDQPAFRYGSLKADRVFVRQGPGTDHRILWEFRQAELPVEILAESGNWRQVRDSEGAEGWVLHSLLSRRRTVLIVPAGGAEALVALREDRGPSGRELAKLQRGVLAGLLNCDGKSCEIAVAGKRGYVGQAELWGVYPNEIIK